MDDVLAVTVECYAGYRGDERPIRFHLGERSIEVADVVDRWLAPDHRYFKVRAVEGDTYILRHDLRSGHWELTMFERARPGTVRLTYVGGPTALIECGGARLLTDPTFDPAGSEYATALYTLCKTRAPAIGPDALGRIDAVLLSHDHHFDNLDRAGRALLREAGVVITTEAGAERLGAPAVGLAPWQAIDVSGTNGQTVRITATPARHGPDGGDRGPVIGFLMAAAEQPDAGIYVSGDTVWYEGVEQVARRARVRCAILFLGAARVRAVGPAHLTFTAEEAVQAARTFGDALIVPLHFEGWEHFSEGRADIEEAFARAGLADRLRWLEPGVPAEMALILQS
jgi:L-ascorbate metabolism protein UlaG (beta-lactamase superfamily)